MPAAAFAAASRLVRPAGTLLLLVGIRALLPALSPNLAGQFGAGTVDLLEQSLAAAVWLAAALLAIRALDVCVWSRREPHLPRLLTDLIAAVIWLTVGFAIAGRVLGMPLAGIITTSGVAVAVLGFALRDMLASLCAGIALSVEGSFRIGDWLEIEPGRVGQVIEIGWLTTRLLTQDGVGLVVPNAQLATRGFTNFNQRPGPWRDQVTIVLGYEVSPARAERILLAAAAQVQQVQAVGGAGGVPDAKIAACSEQGVVWQLRYWLKSYAERVDTRHRVQQAILRHLFKAGLAPAHRRLDLFHAPMPPRALEHRTQLDILLARSDLFGLLGEEELRALAKNARRCSAPAGSVVVRQGEPGSSLFVVVEGVLDVAVALEPGTPRWARLLAPGDMFGEYSLLTGEPRSATVTARAESLLFEITKTDLDPVLRRCPQLAEMMSRILASRQADSRYLEVAGAETETAPRASEQGLVGRVRAFFGLAHERA